MILCRSTVVGGSPTELFMAALGTAGLRDNLWDLQGAFSIGEILW